MTASHSRDVDEETPLLAAPPVHKKPTPVPWAQVSILLILQLAEPLTSQVVYPFAPEFVRKVGITHGDEGRVGYYVGLMQSIFFATQAMTVLHWSRISDTVGRKPVILTGLCGLSLSMYLFGLSTTYWGAVFSRSLNGALNGNIGVLKSMIAEITDSTNLAQVYAYMPIAWATGGTIGPIIGGTLARPAERFPETFGDSEFMRKYPYFLACAVPATFSAIAWLVTLFFLKETVPSAMSLRSFFSKPGTKDYAETPASSRSSSRTIDASEQPYPLRALLIPRVLIAAANYASLSLVDIAYRAVQPLFFATPIELGGLGLAPPIIGRILSAFGILNGFFQVLFFARIHDRWGTRNVFIAGMMSAIPVFMFFPAMSTLAKDGGVGMAVWVLVALQIICSLGLSLCYGCIFIYLSAASPNRASLGATNGLAQLMVSVMRAVGPAAANSLYSLSIQHNYLGGRLVYIVLLGIAVASAGLAYTLPRQVWHNQAGK
ncbi:MFS general substrate transporter [Auriscalpium vulgare]|uniref:MFS general substrate transporter n=1 Tax=Auriscalpium vulgare TaxID=40419 RepID=A0ACB8R614_9AGAM|nr:MFS general substrate transporter [Auriscalpium vulgare]